MRFARLQVHLPYPTVLQEPAKSISVQICTVAATEAREMSESSCDGKPWVTRAIIATQAMTAMAEICILRDRCAWEWVTNIAWFSMLAATDSINTRTLISVLQSTVKNHVLACGTPYGEVPFGITESRQQARELSPRASDRQRGGGGGGGRCCLRWLFTKGRL